MKQKDEKQNFLSIPQAAKLLGVSRIAIYKSVKNGKIRAKKIGRQFIIAKNDILSNKINIQAKPLNKTEKKEIHKAVMRTIEEYGEVLDLLGKE